MCVAPIDGVKGLNMTIIQGLALGTFSVRERANRPTSRRRWRGGKPATHSAGPLPTPETSRAASAKHPFHARHQRGRLNFQRLGKLAQGSQRGLPNPPLHLANKGAVDVRTQSKRLLRNPTRIALLPQYFPKDRGDAFCCHSPNMIRCPVVLGPRDMIH